MLRNCAVVGIVVILTIFLLPSCSNGIVQPESGDHYVFSNQRVTSSDAHQCWGLYQFLIDPDNQTLEVVTLREATLHLNALPFLEPPPPTLITLESVQFSGNTVTADIGLRHPFQGGDEFTGFDVCGTLITDGNLFGFQDSEIRLPKPDETRLLNADGYIRWWNPPEFPHDGTMFGYQDGELGLPDEVVEYASTINGYKYFCDSLDFDDPVTDADLVLRGVFSAGKKNVRRYEIQWDQYGLIFNYAIDASWQFPQGSPPWIVPDSFGPNANRPEAWNIVVMEIENTLFNDGASSGGDLSLSIDVYDWYNPELNVLRVESPGHFPVQLINTPSGGGPGFSTYEVKITGINPPEEWLDILITAECEQIGYQGLLPGRRVSAYQRYFAPVSPEAKALLITSPNGGEVWDAFTDHSITWDSEGPVGDVKLEYSKDDFADDIHLISPSTENDGEFTWFIYNDPTTTAKVRISEIVDPAVYDISDEPFTINQDNTPIWPYYGHDERGTCLSEFNGTTSDTIKWTYDDDPVSSSPAIGPDGTIYCGLYISTGPTSAEPALAAIDPVDGSEKWRHYPGIGNYPGYEPCVSSDGKYVYYGGDGGVANGYRGRIYCINAQDGTEEWYYQLDGSITFDHELIDGGPKIGIDGSIYFQSWKPMSIGRMWAITSNGVYKWHHTLNGWGYSNRQHHSPCIGNDDNIYLTDPGGQCWKFDSDGNSLWSDVYVNYHTRYPGSLDADNNFYVVCSWGLDVNKFATNGNSIWTTPQWEFSLYSGPAHDSDGYIYATGGNSGNGYWLRKLDPVDGSYVWERDLEAITTALMAISADGIIYVGCGNGTNGAGLQAWDTTGNQVFSIDFDWQASSPVIGADDTVYVEADGKLYAIGD